MALSHNVTPHIDSTDEPVVQQKKIKLSIMVIYTSSQVHFFVNTKSTVSWTNFVLGEAYLMEYRMA